MSPEPFSMGAYRGSLRITATNDVIDAMFVVDEEQLTVNTGGETLGSWPLSELAPDDTGTQVLLALDGERVVIEVPDHASFVSALTPTERKRKRRREKKQKSVRKPAKGANSAKPKRAPKSLKRKPKVVPPPEPVATPVSEPEPELEPAPASEPAPVLEPEPAPEPEPEPVFEPEPALEPDPPVGASPSQMPKPEAKHRARRKAKGKAKRDVKGAISSLLDREAWERRREDPATLLVVAAVGAVVVLALAVFATQSLGMILVLLGMVTLVVVALAVSDDLTAYSWVPGSISHTALVVGGMAAMAIGGLLILIG